MSSAVETLEYQSLFERLGGAFRQDRARVDLRGVTGEPFEIRTYPFLSEHWDVHPEDDYHGTEPTLRALMQYYLEQSPYSDAHVFGALHKSDREVEENRRFKYSIFLPPGEEQRGYDSAILLLHGLNEKTWFKYLPWAYRLASLTGRPVILFPIAFHMNRAPAVWANPREMIQVARERQRLLRELEGSSFANAALSHRLHFAPHRFLTSGLQSYFDILDLAEEIYDGRHELFETGAGLDILAYSAGATLGEMLLIADRKALFRRSRALLFCGGSVLDQANPVNKAIMDKEAHRELLRFLRAFSHSSEPAARCGIDPRIQESREVLLFRSLLLRDQLSEIREEAVGKIADRVRLLSMAQDRVFHPEGMRRSWTTQSGRALLKMERLDPDYSYTHEDPFPIRSDAPHTVSDTFEAVMDRAAGWLTSNRG